MHFMLGSYQLHSFEVDEGATADVGKISCHICLEELRNAHRAMTVVDAFWMQASTMQQHPQAEAFRGYARRLVKWHIESVRSMVQARREELKTYEMLLQRCEAISGGYACQTCGLSANPGEPKCRSCK